MKMMSEQALGSFDCARCGAEFWWIVAALPEQCPSCESDHPDWDATHREKGTKMQVIDMQAKITDMVTAVQKAANENGTSAADKEMAKLFVTGAMLLGELLLDVKRIAEAAEKVAEKRP